jgi:superfamily II DNA helicase RecQ
MVYVCAKTRSGKLAIPLTAGSLLSRVIITLVSLVGLGSDQVSKSTHDGSFIEAYHVNEHRGPDATLLKKRLLSITAMEAKHVSIFLYMSPQSLQPNLFWHKVLHELALKNMISLMCIDEAHTVAQDGKFFWPEFHTVVKTLRKLYKTQTMKCSCIAMLATFRESDQDVISK